MTHVVPRSPRGAPDPAPRRRRGRAARRGAVALAVAAGFVGLSGAPASSAEPASYGAWGSGTLSEQDLTALVGRMTLPEKIGMLHGATDPPAECAQAAVGCVGQAGYVPGVQRLGVPPLRLTDGPAGIRLSYHETALPAPVGLAATFDPDAAEEFGEVEGREGRATNQDVLLAPMVNQVNFATGGRNFETTGEDPLLGGRIGTAIVKGVQRQGLIATVKHFIENDFENSRQQTNVAIDERTLHETELQAFEATLAADPGAVMCSYNRINDVFGCSQDELQNDVLRDALGFGGWIMSDWGATHSTADLIAGLDMEMPRGTRFSEAALTAAVQNGTAAVPATTDVPATPAYTGAQWSAAVDAAVLHILRPMNKAGLLEGTPYGTRDRGGAPYVPARPNLASLKKPHNAIARRLAEDGATLLKNDDGGLPLARDAFAGRGTVVMGPTATAPYIGGGGSAHVTPDEPITSPWEALNAAAGSDASLSWVPGYDLDGELLPSRAVTAPAGSTFAGQNGWLRQQITPDAVASGAEPVPQPGGATDALDPTVNAAGLPAGSAWRWRTTLTAPSSGQWQLKVFVKDQRAAQLFVDGLDTASRRVNLGVYGTTSGIGGSSTPAWNGLDQASKSHDPAMEKFQQGTYTVTFAAGETHTLDLRAYANATDDLSVRMQWVSPDWADQKISEAAQAASFASTAVVFAYDEGTEGADRGGNDQAAGLTLPGYQDRLIAAVAKANPNTVVVLNTGDPVLTPWAGDVRSILEMWYPGQQGGPATADVLTGAANPGGKLPVTFPADATQHPTYDPGCTDPSITGNCPLYPGVAVNGHAYRTIFNLDATRGNGIFQGYRWYDRHDVAPRFAFGHGLSYTRFDYSDLDVQRDGSGLAVGFTVRNAGDRAGAEVPQVYVGPPASAPVELAKRSLADFERIELAPGESRRLTLHVAQRQLSYWSTEQHGWVQPAGDRPVYVGASSRDVRLERTGVTPPPAPGGSGPGAPGTPVPTPAPTPAPGTPKPAVHAPRIARGAVRVSTRRAVRLRVSVGRTRGTRGTGTVRLGSGRTAVRRTFTVTADRLRTVTLRLPLSTYRTLVRRGRLRVPVVLTSRGSDGRVRTTRAQVTLLAPRR